VNILLLLIPISLLLIGVAIWAFAWAVRRGQFEDLDAAALDVLVDERTVAHAAHPDASPSPNPRTDARCAAPPAQAVDRARGDGAQAVRPPAGTGVPGQEPPR
jgi:cbb3-type cytochrome oxidase maturation protein